MSDRSGEHSDLRTQSRADDRMVEESIVEAWRAATPHLDSDRGLSRFLESAERMRATRASRARPFLFATAATLAACLLLFAAFLVGRRPSSQNPPTSTGSGLLDVWLATDEKEMPLSFGEGSRLVILPDSRGRVEKMSAEGASFLVERGEVRAEVVHREHTDWRFLAGPFEVQVTGTVLDVAWDPGQERFSVSVSEGAVVVRGPEVGPRRVVRAGERCVVDLPSHTMKITSESDPIVDTTAAPSASSIATSEPSVNRLPASSAPVESPSAHVAATPWTEFEERADYKGAYAAAESAGLASLYRASSADELLRLSQVAQLSGHASSAREALLACRRRFPDGEPSAVAAYELGRASSPSEAAGWFETYLREQPSGPLAREALGRLIEVESASQNDSAAREAAKRYLARFPDGPSAALAKRVLGGAHE